MIYIYVFDENSRAGRYGIGTYIQQLQESIATYDNISLNIVRISANVDEFKIEYLPNYNLFLIPNMVLKFKTMMNVELYYRNISYLLYSYISSSSNDKLIFHLNYCQQYHLVSYLRKMFVDAKIIFTIHYQEWCFMLKGNVLKYKSILHNKAKSTELSDKSAILLDIYTKEKRLFEDVDSIICLSKYTFELLRDEYFISLNKMQVIYNGLKDYFNNEFEISILKYQSVTCSERIIVFVGRLDEIKGCDILIDAFKLVLVLYSNCKLLIIGDGLYYSKYLKLSADIDGRIVFMGHLEKKDLYDCYGKSYLGVVPSFHEQCSYVAIEMMMFSLPIIASMTTGLNEMIEDEISGSKFNELDNREIVVKSLAEKILNVLNMNNESYQKISKASRLRYEKEYQLSIMSRKMTLIYK